MEDDYKRRLWFVDTLDRCSCSNQLTGGAQEEEREWGLFSFAALSRLDWDRRRTITVIVCWGTGWNLQSANLRVNELNMWCGVLYHDGRWHGVVLRVVCLQCLVEDISHFAEEEFLRKYLFRIISIGNQRLNRICWHIVSSFKFVEHYRWLHCWLQVSPDDFRNRMKHWYWKEKGMKMCRDVAIDNVIEQLIFSTVHGLQTNLRKRRIVKQWWSVHSALQWSVNRDLVHGVLF